MKHLSSCHSPFFCIVREKTAIPVKYIEKNLSSDSFFFTIAPQTGRFYAIILKKTCPMTAFFQWRIL